MAVHIPENYTSLVRAIAVSGNDVYIAGGTPNDSLTVYGLSVSTYWKKGIAIYLNSLNS